MTASDNGKPTLAMYWASSCGGCEISTLNIGENILVVDEVFDLAFFPCIADFKVKDVEGYPDGHIDVCLFNGAIRNSENEHMARLLRQKSKVLVAFGSCSYEGCIPALSNLTSRDATLRRVFLDNPSIDNPDRLLPKTLVAVPEGDLTLPSFYNTVKSLDQVVKVDYTIPGCPPEPHQIWTVLQAVVAALTQGAPLPPSGVVGADQVAVCEECGGKDSVGLLGLNVSGQFTVTLDPDRHEMVLKPLPGARSALVCTNTSLCVCIGDASTGTLRIAAISSVFR